ncbi:MAG: thiol-disulfide oxidoreductase DCC family protein [Planctomycetia bacterium]
MITTHVKPDRDTVLYDGHCRFCRSQIAMLRALSPCRRPDFFSLHDPSVAERFPELSHDDLLSQMYVVDPQGRARGGAEAVRYLSRRLPLLWPLALLLHIPGSLPLWKRLYAFVARHRLWIAGACGDGGCRLPHASEK